MEGLLCSIFITVPALLLVDRLTKKNINTNNR